MCEGEVLSDGSVYPWGDDDGLKPLKHRLYGDGGVHAATEHTEPQSELEKM